MRQGYVVLHVEGGSQCLIAGSRLFSSSGFGFQVLRQQEKNVRKLKTQESKFFVKDIINKIF